MENNSEEQNSEDLSGPMNLLSPEGVIMMTLAIITDTILFLLFISVVGNLISWLVGLFATFIFGLWLSLRGSSSDVSMPKMNKNPQNIKKLGKIAKWVKKTKWLKPLCLVSGNIPFLNGFVPTFVILVYAEIIQR